MAIIYSYEQEANPHFSDLLLGTDVSAVGKPTKSFSIQSIVDLVQSVIPGGGTVTSVATNDTSFISMGGGPILTSGTLTASLSATGVPSVNTFLRGDNTWSTIPASPNTLYTLSSSLVGTNVNINLDGTDSTKTVVSLAAGPNISLTDNGSNRITIGVTNLPAGTVTSVTTGKGLEIQSGTATKDPKLAIDITGSNNYIKISEDQTTAFAEDIIAFNQNSSTNVKTTKFGEITPTSLTLIKNYIDAGDAGDITNTTDNYETTASVKNVVTLTSAEYTALAQKDANTMYIIAGAQPTYTTTLAFTNNIVGTEYTIIGDQAGLQKTGPVNSSYAYNTTVSPNEGYYFSVPASITNASGLFTADETVNTILSGTVSAIADPGVTATLALQIAPSMGVEGVEYTLGGNVSGNTVTGSSPLDYSFNTIVNVTPGYTAITPVVVNNASSARDGQLNANETVITYITGAIEKDPGAEVTVTADIIENFTGAHPNEATVVVTPLSFGGDSPVSYDFNVSVVANEGYYFVEPPVITGDLTGTSEVTRDAVINVSGQIEQVSNTAVVNLEITNTIDGPSNGYTVTTVPSSLQLIGEVPFAYNFNTTVTLNEGFEWVSGVPPTINNAAGTTSVIGEQTVTTTISNAQVAETTQLVEATLNVDYVITGDAVWSPAGDLTGTIQSGLPPFQYNWNNTTEFPNRKPTIVIDQPGYGFSVAPYTVPSSIADQIVEDTTVNVTVYATIVPIIETGSVTLDVENNITPSGTTSVTVTKYLNGVLDESEGNTIEGVVGDSYSFYVKATPIGSNDISSGPFYSEGNPVSGIISSGNIIRTQTVTGETSPLPCGLIYGQIQSSVVGDPSTICDLPITETYYFTGNTATVDFQDLLWVNQEKTIPLPDGYYKIAITSNGSCYYSPILVEGGILAGFGSLCGQFTPIEEVVTATGRTWMAYNLGASRPATSLYDSAAQGSLYQWGRDTDGHQLLTSSVDYNGTSNTDDPNSTQFITGGSQTADDWRYPQNDNLWQGVDGINNPGLYGYRLPTQEEWQLEIDTWESRDIYGGLASPLKLPIPKFRNGSTGSISQPETAIYATSDVSNTTSIAMAIYAQGANAITTTRASGHGVRLIKDNGYWCSGVPGEYKGSVAGTYPAICGLALDQKYYVTKVGTSGNISQGTLIYTNPEKTIPLATGTYLLRFDFDGTCYNYMITVSDGVIQSFSSACF